MGTDTYADEQQAPKGRRAFGLAVAVATAASAVIALTIGWGNGVAGAAASPETPTDVPQAMFRIEFDLLKIRPDRANAFGARLCRLPRHRGDDAYASVRFGCRDR